MDFPPPNFNKPPPGYFKPNNSSGTVPKPKFPQNFSNTSKCLFRHNNNYNNDKVPNPNNVRNNKPSYSGSSSNYNRNTTNNRSRSYNRAAACRYRNNSWTSKYEHRSSSTSSSSSTNSSRRHRVKQVTFQLLSLKYNIIIPSRKAKFWSNIERIIVKHRKILQES